MVRALVAAFSVGFATSINVQVVEEKQHQLRQDWEEVGKPHGGEQHKVAIAVKQQNLDLLYDKLMEVSSPGSDQRGQYMSWDEAQGMTANPNATVSILSWLGEHGIQVESVHKHGHYIKAQANVSTWEQALSTTFARFAPTAKQIANPVLRAVTDVSMPQHVAEVVQGIFMTTQMPPPTRPGPQYTYQGEVGTGFLRQAPTGSRIDPAIIKEYYKVSGEGSSSVSHGVFESLNQVASPSDLQLFQEHFNLPNQPIEKDVGQHVSDFACKFSSNLCAEANLDVQYMMAMSPNAPFTYWYDSDVNTPFEDWITNVASDPSPPKVNSISYGAPETLMSESVMKAFNIEAMKLGVQGVTIFVSSGDDGVANNQARDNSSACGYQPSFPAVSPYVTAVGATQGGPNGGPEVACSSATGGSITTGGGFSFVFPTPEWQASAVESFLAKNNAVAPGFNQLGRGYPDLAMAGFNYQVVIGGNIYLVSGTSASAPVVAGMATLINSRLSEQGKPTMGFINPTLYAVNNSNVFNDIVTGDNKCTAGDADAVCCLEGFNAVEGWDPATGWGSVKFPEFQQMFGDAAGRAFHTAIWFLMLGLCLGQ